jgi:hypothetical protein
MSGWSDCSIVFVVRPVCPSCGHPRYIGIRSMPSEQDGSKTLRAVCKRCSSRFLIVSELPDLPEYGDSDFQSGTM